MKANEAPEKIYLQQTTGSQILNGIYYEYKPAKIRYDDKITEYTRTDAFIEKACEWLKESITNNPECNRIISKKGVITMGLLIDDFRKYMEGE